MFQKSNTVKQTYIPDLWLTMAVYDQQKTTNKSHILARYYPGFRHPDLKNHPKKPTLLL